MQNFQSGFNPYAQNVAIVKSYFKKPTVLTQGILYAISAVFTVVSAFFMVPAMQNYINAFFSIPEFTADMVQEELDFLNAFMNVYTNIAVYASIVPAVITAGLTAAAFLIIYSKSKNADPSSVPTVGVTILFVLSIIQLIPIVLVSLILLLVIILLIIVSIATGSSNAEASGALWIITAVYAVVFGAMIAILLIYYINQVRYYNSIRKSLTTVNLSHKGAGIFGVLSIIYGAYTAINALSVFSIKPMMNFMKELAPEMEYIVGAFDSFSSIFALSALSSALSAAIIILGGVIALGYKKHIKTFTEGYSAVMTQQPVVPQPVAPSYEPEIAQAETVAQMPTQMPDPQPQKSEPQFEPVIFNDGTGIVQAPHCPRCGTPSKDGDVFCKACGTKL